MTTEATIKEFEWHDDVAEQAAMQAGEAAAKAGAEAMLNVAMENVPFNTGALASTGQVGGEGLEWAVGFDTEYAGILRAHAADWEFQGGRSGRWLDEAIETGAQNVFPVMEAAARSEWPSG